MSRIVVALFAILRQMLSVRRSVAYTVHAWCLLWSCSGWTTVTQRWPVSHPIRSSGCSRW